ncbi:unnamed protein product, partial [Meganyctiphanes norvegica]
MVMTRGRGGRGMRMMRPMGPGPHFGPKMKQFIPRLPFDMVLCESAFPKVKPLADESAFTQALLKRNTDLSPTPAEQAAVLNLVTKIQAVLDNLIVDPGTFDACQIEEVRQVGSYKKGTMMTAHNVADIVVILKTLPTKEAVEALGKKVTDDLRAQDPQEVNVGSLTPSGPGFLASSDSSTIRITLVSIHKTSRRLILDFVSTPVSPQLFNCNLYALRHMRTHQWRLHKHSSSVVIILLFQHWRLHFDGTDDLHPLVYLMSHFTLEVVYCRQSVLVVETFLHCLDDCSPLFLTGSVSAFIGLLEPCDRAFLPLHRCMSSDERLIYLSGQLLRRVLSHGGYKQILGLEGNSSIASEMSVWDGVVVSALEKAYEKPPERPPQDDDADDMDADDDTMETADN